MMALDPVSNLLVSVASLLGNAFGYAILVFLVAWLVGKRLHRFFQERFRLSWIQSAWLASYALFFVVLIIAFFVPIWQATTQSATGIAPEGIAVTGIELAAKYLFGLLRLLVLSAFFALLALPLIFIAELFKDWLQPWTSNPWLPSFIATWLTVFLTLAIVLFWLPWVVSGLIYLVYWA